jgi:multidrug efflux pump subunit AcrA (membrane-fusion protein)
MLIADLFVSGLRSVCWVLVGGGLQAERQREVERRRLEAEAHAADEAKRAAAEAVRVRREAEETAQLQAELDAARAQRRERLEEIQRLERERAAAEAERQRRIQDPGAFETEAWIKARHTFDLTVKLRKVAKGDLPSHIRGSDGDDGSGGGGGSGSGGGSGGSEDDQARLSRIAKENEEKKRQKLATKDLLFFCNSCKQTWTNDPTCPRCTAGGEMPSGDV